jgi:flagellar protein FlgJ
MPPSAFIALLVDSAQACQQKTGIPASFTIAQAALESAWGARAIGNNLFGIKADKAWTGPTVTFGTHEHEAGQDVAITDRFRAYPNWLASMEDHAAFLKANGHYADCWDQSTGEGWARAIAADHYATDPGYANKLVSIIRTRGLARLDVIPSTKAIA